MGENLSPDFIDLRSRADFLELCGDLDEAERLRDASMKVAREVDLTCYAYQLMWREQYREAIDILERNAAAHPESWNVYDSLAEAYEQSGQRDIALANYALAAELAPEGSERERIEARIDAMTHAVADS